MSNYTLQQGLYLYPTPAGAYYAISAKEIDKTRQFLRNLLFCPETPTLDAAQLIALTAADEEEKAFELLYHCQQLGLVQGLAKPLQVPAGPLEELLPPRLGKIAESGKILLCDSQGFYLASYGLPHEAAEEFSVLGAEIAALHDRRAGLLVNNLRINSNAWAIVGATGNSQAGFWPIFIGETRFLIAVIGIPHFNQPEFVELVWTLTNRYMR